MAKAAKKPGNNESSGPGGAREGAGRKRLYGEKIATTTVAAAVPVPLLVRLDKWAAAHGLTRSRAVTEAIRRLVE